MAREEILYEQLAGKIRHQISADVLRPGVRLPSVRELSREQRVSVSTVLQAYGLLETEGYIEARPQSGYYVKSKLEFSSLRPLRGVDSPKAVRSQDALMNVIDACGNPNYIALGSAVVDAKFLPWELLSKALVKQVKNSSAVACGYGPSQGADEYRRQVARRSLSHGCDLEPEDIVATVGATEAIHLALGAVTQPGDIVAVESPTYHGIIESLRLANLKVLEIAMDPDHGMDLVDLEQKISQHPVKAIIAMPNFNNPLGTLMSDEAKQKLVRMATKHEIPIIEDDVYGDLSMDETRHRTLKSFDTKNWVLLCSSFSKTLAPGFRAGWIAPGPRFFEKTRKLKFASSLSAMTAGHLAVADFLKNNNYEKHLRQLRSRLTSNLHMSVKKIQERFPAGTRLSCPRGGFVVWVEMPGKVDSFELHRLALEKNVSVVPGPLFSPSGRFRNCIRLNSGIAWGAETEKGMEIIGALAHDLSR